MNEQAIGVRLAAFDDYRKQFSRIQQENGDNVNLREWTPFRSCSQDYVLTVRVVRIRGKRFEVGLFAAKDHYRFVKGASVMMGLITCLSDAFYKTGSMALFFRGPSYGQSATLETGFESEVPSCIRELAKSLGIMIKQRAIISHEEGISLYLRITGISSELESQIGKVGIDPVQIAFQLNRGIWTREQVELICANSLEPKACLQGVLRAENRLAFQRNMLLLRCGMLAERLKTLLSVGSINSEQESSGSWFTPIVIGYILAADCSVEGVDGRTLQGRRGQLVKAYLLPAYAEDLNVVMAKEIAVAADHGCNLLLLAKDFDWASTTAKSGALAATRQKGICVVTSTDTLGELDQEIFNRLAQAESTRRSIPERPE